MHDALRGREGEPQPAIRCFEVLAKYAEPRTSVRDKTCLRGVCSGDVAFQLVDGPLLFRDNPYHQVADRDPSDDLLSFHDRQMTYTVIRHNAHALLNRVLVSQEPHRASHDFFDLGFP